MVKIILLLDVARMILLNLQMVLLHVNAGPNSLEASVNNWKLWIVKFLYCGWSTSSGISQTGFKSWLAPEKETCFASSQKIAWHQPVWWGPTTWVVAGFGGFLQTVWLGYIRQLQEIVDTVHSPTAFFAYIKLCEDLLARKYQIR